MSKISKIGVIGAGHMGSGIAQKIAQEGLDVVLVDRTEKYVKNGISNIKNLLKKGVKRRIFNQQQADNIISRITGTIDYQEVADADIVVEAVFEDKEVKTKLFQKLDDICNDKTIFATNTSSFYVSEFAKKINRPDRFIGLHYFFHPAKNRLLEIIPHKTTSDQTIKTAQKFAKLHAKTAIIVKDSPGFAVNRFFIPSSNEACRMFEEGLGNIPTIEEGSKRAFGIGMGSFEILNVTGIPLAVHASQSLGDELGLFYKTPDILKEQMDKNEDWVLKNGDIEEKKINAIVDRFYGICLGVAATLVDEGVASVEDIDLGAKMGLRWSKGPFEIMNHLGMDKTYACVKAMTQKYPGFKMPDILTRQKALGQPFPFKLVNLELKDSIAFITINRPDALNALNETVVEQLIEKFNLAQNNPQIKGIVFQGAGKAFVAGADIQFFVNKIKDERIGDIEAFTRKGHKLFLAIENCPKKTIAVLDGLSLGGGSEMALACQYIIATDAGSMGFPETGIGIIPGLGGMFRMERQIGAALAKHYVFTGETLSARDAYELGIVHKIVLQEDIDAVLRKMIDQKGQDKYRKRSIPERFRDRMDLCHDRNIEFILNGKTPDNGSKKPKEATLKILGYKSPIALKMANEVLNKQITMTIEEAIEFELSQLDKLFNTKDALEGLSSAGHKRPVFTGE